MSRRRGLSLVESLVVTAIIIILLGLYLPVLFKARMKAHGVTKMNDERNQHITNMMNQPDE